MLYFHYDTCYHRLDSSLQVIPMKNTYRVRFLIAMVIFGTIGLLRKSVPLSSSTVALARGVIGSVILYAVSRFSKVKASKEAIKKNLLYLCLSGAAIGFNWILLFESYNYASVATATLCYYLAPVLVILFAPFAIQESISKKQLFWVFMALVGMAMVSGVFGDNGGTQLKGIAFGVSSAVLYAFVILLNKRILGLPALNKTLIQLFIASVAMVPYILLTEDFQRLQFETSAFVNLMIIGVVHTGLAYWLYFSAVEKLEAHTVALFSYIDPVVAILLSAFFLKEPMTFLGAIGAVIILVSAYCCEKS